MTAMGEDRLTLHPHEDMAEAADIAFQAFRDKWASLLPASAKIEHVGATAIPGCLSKGDLDVCIRISAVEFPEAERQLAAAYDRNTGSLRDETFASFKDDMHAPPLGVQLVAQASELDVFVTFREVVRRDPQLVADYNELKKRFAGRAMDDYRAAKSAFIADVLARTRAGDR